MGRFQISDSGLRGAEGTEGGLRRGLPCAGGAPESGIWNLGCKSDLQFQNFRFRGVGAGGWGGGQLRRTV